MAWPAPIVRLFATLSATWTDARPEVGGELDQLVDQTNAILSEGQAQEARITAHMADLSAHAAQLFPPIGLDVMVGTDVDSDFRVTADAIPMDDGDTILEDVDVTGDIYDSPATGSGGLDTGTAPAIDVLYYAWLISKATTPADEVLVFSLSKDAPSLALLDPAYTATALVGVLRTVDNGSGAAKIQGFIHNDGFYQYLPGDAGALWGDNTTINSAVPIDVDLSSFFPEGCKMAFMGLYHYYANAKPVFSPGPASPLYLTWGNVEHMPGDEGTGNVNSSHSYHVPLDSDGVTCIEDLGVPTLRLDHFFPLGFWWRP